MVIIIEKVESFLVEYFKVFVIIDIFLLNWKRWSSLMIDINIVKVIKYLKILFYMVIFWKL